MSDEIRQTKDQIDQLIAAIASARDMDSPSSSGVAASLSQQVEALRAKEARLRAEQQENARCIARHAG